MIILKGESYKYEIGVWVQKLVENVAVITYVGRLINSISDFRNTR